jgi:Flp pilus assembly pilin Flp
MRRPVRCGSACGGLLLSRERGQNVVEYGLLIASIAVVILMGTAAFGQQIEPWFQSLAGHITTTGT